MSSGQLKRTSWPCLWLVLLLTALPGLAAVPEVGSGDVRELLLSRSISILEDRSSQLTVDDIRSGRHDHEFQAATRDFPGLHNATGTFWVRLSIQNNKNEARDLILENRYPLLDYLTLYQFAADGGRQELTLGDEVAYENRPVAFRYPVYPIHLEPGRNNFIMKMQNKGPFVISLFLWDGKNFDNYARRDNLVLGLLNGSVIVLMLYNMFLMFSFRSQTYLVYVLYLLTFLATQLGLQATANEWIGGDFGHWIMNRGWLILSCLSLAFSCLFALRFLNMHKHMPHWRRWMLFLIFAHLAMTVHGFFADYALLGLELTYSTVVVSVTLIASGLTASWRGFRPAIFYTLAWAFLLFGNVALALMFNGLFPMNFFAQWGNLLGGALEVALMSLALGSRMNYMQARSEQTIKTLNIALTKHIEEVEHIVAERTQTIRSIIDHVKSGFFTINSQLEVEAGFTKACYRLLGDRIRDQASILDVLGLEGSRRSIFQMTVQQVFADSMPEEVSLTQIPRNFRIGDSILILEGGLIRDDDGKPKAILFTVNDITKLRMKQREALRSSMLIKILKNMDAFRSFIKITRENLKHLRDPEVRSKQKMAAFILHTLKGNCLIFNMKAQADRIHKLEEADALQVADIEALERSFQLFLNRHADILSINWDDEHDEDVVLKHSTLRNLRQELNRLGVSQEFLGFFDRWVQSITARSARSLLGPIVDDVQQLARRSGRKVQFDLQGADVKIYSDTEKHLIKNLVHLVRNAVVHGIEPDRGDKPARGTVVLKFRAEKELLEIRCKDDGLGIDRDQIVRLIVEKGLAGAQNIENKSISELIDLLSHDGFSTTTEVDLYSGRGVGVAAVYGAVRACRGRMDIKTEPGQGTEFIITVPRDEEPFTPNLKAV
ncbi:7TM diverse intracellular signaling domain-containing protein [Oligoflexus tunisiensis]|uniref:7TM diverse intracellular signaling domain-containing protein n=1 Tax=Oligoflexus tunisiensis TaxID=708132 RepID=UPI00159EF669|nr:7TM diverse intracellular signaling domain-containing protein [Oligoflexus tunisiensis]